jgi:DNA-binding NarL/FixJ family response regulator
MRGQHYMTPSVTKEMLGTKRLPSEGPMCKRPVTALTPRQREVLQLLAEGKGTRSIASILNISIKTVEFHRARIMEELDLHSVAELTKYAVSEGLVSL